MKKILLALYALFSVGIGLCSQSPNQPPTTASTVGQEKAGYVIGPEDVLSINVWKEPDFSIREIVVRPDGKISLPLINDIQANGLTPRQLQDEITNKLKEFVSSPSVTVSVIRAVSQSVSIVGQVAHAGTYPLGSSLTVLELIARAGGLTEYAKEKDIRVLRKENGNTLQFPFNYKDIIKGKKLQQNITLKSGDVVMVP